MRAVQAKRDEHIANIACHWQTDSSQWLSDAMCPKRKVESKGRNWVKTSLHCREAMDWSTAFLADLERLSRLTPNEHAAAFEALQAIFTSRVDDGSSGGNDELSSRDIEEAIAIFSPHSDATAARDRSTTLEPEGVAGPSR